MHINQYIASCGITSRRKAEDLIKNGRVTVNGQITKDLAFKVDENKDEIKLDGKVLKKEEKVYFLLNKPKGYVTSLSDPHAEKVITELIKTNSRIFPIGRLDKDSSGLIILTNDGELALKLSHPRYDHEKEYLVDIILPHKDISQTLDNALRLFKCGIIIDGSRTKPSYAKVVKQSGNIATLNIILKEGRNRQIRRTLEKAKIKVRDLKRIRIGEIVLGEIQEGQYKEFKSIKELDIER